KSSISSAPPHSGAVSWTSWPREASSSAASRVAATQARSTSPSVGDAVVTATRNRPGSTPTSSAKGRSGGGGGNGSPHSYATTRSRYAAASAVVRASGPVVPSPIPGTNGAFETRQRVALKPSTPQHDPGM